MTSDTIEPTDETTLDPTDASLHDRKHRYEYMPAGFFPQSHAGLAIYIKYATNANRILIRETSPNHTVIECPDRTLHLVGDRHFAEPWPVDFSFDEVVFPSPFWPSNGVELGVPNYMLNYTQAINKERTSGQFRKHGRLPGHRQMIFADSGGFQIQQERFDYLDPKRIVEWYNANVDVGVVLDIPPKGMFWPGLVEQIGEAQAASTEIMFEHARDDLELMNVFHGETIEEVRKFRAIVEDPRMDRVAIGGTYYSSMLQSIDHSCRVIQDGHLYSHYHVLGVSKIGQLYPLMRMAAKGIAPYITSDSSTYLQEALNKGYYVWPEVSAPPRFYKVGDKTNRPNSSRILPCSCPVCSALKYADIFAVYSGNTVSFLMMLHNLFAFSSLTRAMYEIVEDASLDDLKTLLRRQLETRADQREEVLKSIDYVDRVAADGVDAGAEYLRYYLGGVGATKGEPAPEIKTLRTLFNGGAVVARDADEHDDEDDEESVYVIPVDDPQRVRMERILNNYIRHGDLAASGALDHQKVHKKNRIRKEKGHSKANARIVRIPGKRQATRKKKVAKR